MNKPILINTVILVAFSLVIALIAYQIDIWVFTRNEYLRTRLSPNEALLMEGVISALSGILLLLGRGGITWGSLRAAISSATAEALYDRDTVGPSEIYKQDRWKPHGFIRAGLIIILSGMFMILTYFLT